MMSEAVFRCPSQTKVVLNISSPVDDMLHAFAVINVDHFVESECKANYESSFREMTYFPDITTVRLPIVRCDQNRVLIKILGMR